MKSQPCLVLVAVLTLGLGAYATDVRAQAKVKNITQCGVISESGSYLLKKSLQAPAGNSDCLVVETDFVTIDLNGLTITGNGGGNGIADGAPNLRGIAVRNGTVTNSVRGIDLARASGASITAVRAISNTSVGIYVGSYSIVTDNVAVDNVNEGIVADAGSRVTGNTVGHNGTGSGAFGIFVDVGSTISGNTVLGNGRGIFVNCPSNVLENTSTTNTSDNLALTVGCNTSNNVAP